MRRTLVISLLLVGATAALTVQAAPQKPNVIMLFIDDLGMGDIGAFGCKDIPTPQIDRLAKEGVMLTQMYVTNPPCCPSRYSLLMGTYAQRFGKYGMSRGMPLPKEPTFAEVFRDHGYVTGQVGKWDVGYQQGPSARGFMEVAVDPPRAPNGLLFMRLNEKGEETWLTEMDGDRLVEFVDRNRKKGKPFMMYWSPLAVHSPHSNTPEKYCERTSVPKGLPVDKAHGANRRLLGGGIVALDDQIGKLLDYLDKHDMRKNTLIMFASDNGPNVGEGGTSTPYRGGKGPKSREQVGWTLTPGIVSWPGVIPQGTRFDGMMCTFDFYPTMLAAANIPLPDHLDGVDVMPWLTGKNKGNVRDYVYWFNKGNSQRNRNLQAVRWSKWRLYRSLPEEPWRLYDLKKDPREENDVAKQFPEVVKQLEAKHSEWERGLPPIYDLENRESKGLMVPNQNLAPKDGWIISDGRVLYEKPDAETEKRLKAAKKAAKAAKRKRNEK